MSGENTFSVKRRQFVQSTGKLIAAGLLLPFTASAFGSGGEVNQDQIKELRKRIKGTAVPRTDPLYEAWRRSMIWNQRKFERYPEVIVQAENERDVAETLNFARRNGLQVKTRGGGHCWSGTYLRNSGILLDLSRFQSIEIDVDAKKAVVGAGVLSRNLAYHLGRAGLAFPVAHSGMVPISGFLLGGGLGWNANFWGGISVFNIEALDIVTADGQLRHVNADSDPELFWAARGAGPGLFFTVTRFYLQCHSLPRAITSDTFILPLSELAATVELMSELGPTIDRSVEMLSVVIPGANDCAPTNCERIVLFNAKAFADSPSAAKQMLDPLRKQSLLQTKAIQKEIGREADFEHLFQEEEVGFPQRRGRADNILTDRATEAVPVIEEHVSLAPSVHNTPLILYLGEQEFPDAAYSAKGSFYMSAYAQWDDAANDSLNGLWLRNFYDDMQPFASGFYINEFDREARSTQVGRCFSEDSWERLRALKQEYDPKNVFHDFFGLPGHEAA